jgi:hypothetical protein
LAKKVRLFLQNNYSKYCRYGSSSRTHGKQLETLSSQPQKTTAKIRRYGDTLFQIKLGEIQKKCIIGYLTKLKA